MTVHHVRRSASWWFELQPGARPRVGDILDTGFGQFRVLNVAGPHLGALGYRGYDVTLRPVGVLEEGWPRAALVDWP